MNIAHSIFGRDLARLAQDGGDETKLIGRPTTDPNSLAEANFMLETGMTRVHYEEMQTTHRRLAFEERAVADLTGDPPADICRTKGLGPKRALFARFHEWRWQEAKKLSDLQTKKAELEALIAAPAATEVQDS